MHGHANGLLTHNVLTTITFDIMTGCHEMLSRTHSRVHALGLTPLLVAMHTHMHTQLVHKHITHLLSLLDGVDCVGSMRFNVLEPPRTSA